MTTSTSAHRLIAAERVNGTAVYNSAGDRIGRIDDIAIDKISGQVAYAILSFGGFLGIGDRQHPLPWSVLDYDPDKGGYVVPMTKAELENAPSFNPSELSGWDDSGYRDSVFAYYAPFGGTAYWM